MGLGVGDMGCLAHPGRRMGDIAQRRLEALYGRPRVAFVAGAEMVQTVQSM
jgi:hypothetical protein